MWLEIDWAKWRSRDRDLQKHGRCDMDFIKTWNQFNLSTRNAAGNWALSTYQLKARLGFQLIKTLPHRFKENSKIMTWDWGIILENGTNIWWKHFMRNYGDSRIWIWNEILRWYFIDGVCFDTQRNCNLIINTNS